MPQPPDVHRLWSVDESYVDAQGERRTVDPGTRRRVQTAIETSASRAVGRVGGRPGVGGTGSAPVVAGPDDRAVVGRGTLRLEDGGEHAVADRLPSGLPLGYHEFRPADDAGPVQRVIISPRRCPLPDWFPAWGWSVQLYALRSRRSWGVGDLGDLRDFGRLAASQGASVVLVNPLHATAPAPPVLASPYSPSSRRYLSPLWLRVEDVPGAGQLPELAALTATATSLDHERLINRDASFRLKLHALKQLWEHTAPDPGFERFLTERGTALRHYATFCALAEHLGMNWREWPEEYRRPESGAVARYGDDHPEVAVHAWAQYLVDRQLQAASAEIGLIQDLPVGFDTWGADAWEYQDVVVDGYAVGAPPDVFNPAGQDWGLPVLSPPALAAVGYEPFVQTIRASLRHAAGLRIDHVMGLFRQWWVPAGSSPAQGAYVRFPASDLLDIVALESHRAGAFVVGEDLGTVEPGVRTELAARNVLSYRLLWFEDEPPSRWPACSLGAVSTHDLPTVPGVWTGADADEQLRLGLTDDPSATDELRDRLARAAGLDVDAPVGDAVDAAHRLLAGAASGLVAVSLEDVLEVAERPNLPGADAGRPNWSLALPVDLDDLAADRRVARVAEAMASRRAGAGPAGPAVADAGGGAGSARSTGPAQP